MIRRVEQGALTPFGNSSDVGWSYLKPNGRYQRTTLCKDPFRPSDPRVDEMINSY